MSNIVDIKTLRDQFEEKIKSENLQEFATSQQKLIEKLLLENKRIQDKNKHLEQVMKQLSSLDGVVSRISPEEMICIEQINILHNRSADRELTLDEVKRLDLLVKNLRLIRDVSSQTVDILSHGETKVEELVAIARTED